MIRLNWIGGEHDFALTIDRLRALQQHTDAGPEQLLRRFGEGDWRIDDMIEVLRQGLMGGGMEAKDAGPLVLNLVAKHPLLHFKETAFRVLGASLVGPEDDRVGESEGATKPPENGLSVAS